MRFMSRDWLAMQGFLQLFWLFVWCHCLVKTFIFLGKEAVSWVMRLKSTRRTNLTSEIHPSQKTHHTAEEPKDWYILYSHPSRASVGSSVRSQPVWTHQTLLCFLSLIKTMWYMSSTTLEKICWKFRFQETFALLWCVDQDSPKPASCVLISWHIYQGFFRGLYKCVCILFGLSNSPLVLQWSMEESLESLRDKCCIPKLNGALYYAKILNEQVEGVHNVLQALKHHGVKLKPENWMKKKIGPKLPSKMHVNWNQEHQEASDQSLRAGTKLVSKESLDTGQGHQHQYHLPTVLDV